MDWPPQSSHPNRIENLWDVLERPLRSGPTLPSSLQNLNATLDGNKCRDIAEAHRNNATANVIIRAKGPTKY